MASYNVTAEGRSDQFTDTFPADFTTCPVLSYGGKDDPCAAKGTKELESKVQRTMLDTARCVGATWPSDELTQSCNDSDYKSGGASDGKASDDDSKGGDGGSGGNMDIVSGRTVALLSVLVTAIQVLL